MTDTSVVLLLLPEISRGEAAFEPRVTDPIQIPAGTQPGTSMRLKGRGMPDLKDGKKTGDLIVNIQVSIPDKLSAELALKLSFGQEQ